MGDGVAEEYAAGAVGADEGVVFEAVGEDVEDGGAFVEVEAVADAGCEAGGYGGPGGVAASEAGGLAEDDGGHVEAVFG